MVDTYIPLRFGIDNHVPDATLTATPAAEAAAPLDNIKNEWRARQAIWTSVTQDLIIEGSWTSPRAAQYVALPNSTLLGLDSIRLELFSDDSHATRIYNTGFNILAEPPPLGVWVAGIDAFGTALDEDRPSVYAAWITDPVICRSFRLTIRKSSYSGGADIALRTVLIGRTLEMQHNFVYGASLRYLTAPTLSRTANGSHYPSRPQKRSRSLSLSLPMMSNRDRAALARMERDLGGSPFLVSAYPGRSGWQFDDYAFLARFADTLDYEHVFEDIHATNLQLVEV